MPTWFIPFSLILIIYSAACSIAIYQWKKWGFWGVCIGTIVSLIVELLIGRGINYGSIMGVFILFIILNLGGEKKAWSQLE